MSVILDALKKLDREKTSRRKGTANIAVEILRPDLTYSGKRIPVTIITVAVTAIAAAVITYGVMLEFGFLSKSSPPATKSVPASSQQVAPASPEPAAPSKLSLPAPVNPPAVSKHIPAPVPRVPVRNAQDEVARVSPKVKSVAEKKDHADVKIPVETKSPVAPVVDKKESPNVVSKEVGTTPKKATEPAPNISATNPASLKLSAIVWYEEPSRRFAMINGIMATEGSSVDGIQVVEINPTSVRLLHNGQYFEISMSK
jgi:general secretion pathway protein B